MSLDEHLAPRTITMITTYGCTAECRQCCFESSPRVKGRLSLEEMTQSISDAKRNFPSLLVQSSAAARPLCSRLTLPQPLRMQLTKAFRHESSVTDRGGKQWPAHVDRSLNWLAQDLKN